MLRCESINAHVPTARVKILQKSYKVLVSMAPISPDTTPIISCLPRHFGPPLAEATSPWFRLFAYSVAGSGPPSVLLVKGTRVRRIPSLFEKFEKLLLCTWNRETSIVSIETLLVNLNELLLTSPVLVQGYSYHSQPEIRHVAFPLPERSQLDPSDLRSHPSLWALQKNLHLSHSFGYMTMINLSGRGSDAVNQWYPMDVVFGMPLFDVDINEQVCQSIQERSLFSESSMRQHSRNSRLLSLQLLEFITEYQGLPVEELSIGEVFLPTQQLTFDGKTLLK
eukprot:TRINITY_DN5552_c0_g1_i2.p1 TRINITY_DN5552_c0_g1~~TRINITY_DN5552_c0_g1_i2.p1  ORF type:complete len:280 (+),score=52.35 TRINITY_DN5552_c0_g1_i2:198-1037(+)